MKIVNICKSDWANFSYDNCMALQSVGIDCSSYAVTPHVFDYPSHATIIKTAQIYSVCSDADIIQIFHSDYSCLDIVKPLGKKLVVYHTGSGYRSESEKLNNLFNPFLDISFTALGELMNKGAKNEFYIVGAIDTNEIVPIPIESNIPVFSHYPSKSNVKGTDTITHIMKEIGKRNKFIFNYNEKDIRLSLSEQRSKMQNCDIYIELLKPELNGNKYGSWGITALEAAAMGKIVVTQNLSNEVYEKHYGGCPLILVADEHDFIKKINWLLSLTKKEIRNLQEQTRTWVEEKHSYKATGEYLKNILCDTILLT